MSKRPFSKHHPASQSVKAALEYLAIPEPNSGCWIWVGASFEQRMGYGSFTARKFNIVNQRAHRVSYKIYCHDIDESQHVLHRCDTPPCINPDHLFLGSWQENMDDKVSKLRQNRGDTHGRSKIKEADALAIIKDNRKQKDIAEQYGVSVPTISDIKRGKSWKHLPR